MSATSILGKIVGSAATSPLDAVSRIINAVYTTDGQTMDKQAILNEIAQRPGLVQAEINKMEAQHRSVFVAGWRPFIGWVCGFALLYSFIIRDLIAWGISAGMVVFPEPPPELALEHLMTILLALLGLGGFRTFEKFTGRAK